MNFIDITKNELNNCFTENGDRAFKTSGSFCLDFFALSGSLRENKKELLKLFLKAYNENKNTAIRILFYLRDIRGGLGERSSFRLALNILANFYPSIARQVIKYIPLYGRFDDLLSLINTPVEDDMINVIKEQLDKDIKLKEEGRSISLLSKWMPSVNASNKLTRSLAKRLSQKLGYTYEEYRKILSSLRKDSIIENNLREKDYSFEYDKIPGKAFLKYREAFYRNDYTRISDYLDSIKRQVKSSIKTDAISPYEVVRIINNTINHRDSIDEIEYDTLNAIWDAFTLEKDNSKTMVVRDGSGSMYRGCSCTNPIDIADAFTILYSSSLTGDFKNTFITFSSKPQLVKLNSTKLEDKLKELVAYNDCSNTDIEKVYDLILNVYQSKNFKKEDALDRIVIISDMEFDQGVNSKKTTFETFKDKFMELGYEMPEVVFLNVAARDTHLPVTMNETNVKLIGGSSKYILDLIVKNNSVGPYNFMMECLKKYDFVDKLNLEV